MPKQTGWFRKAVNRVFGKLLRAYPEEFQADFGTEMRQLVKDRSRGEPAGRLMGELIVDTLRVAPREHLAALWRDTRHAVRGMRRNPGFTTVAVASLAIGIGANAAMFSLADALLLRPLSVEEPGRLFVLRSSSPDIASASVSYPDFVSYRERAKSFAGMVAHVDLPAGLARTKAESPRMRYGMAVSADFFHVLGVGPSLGRPFAAHEGEVPGRDPVMVLGYRFWEREFQADRSAVGAPVYLNGVEFRVVGVASESFDGMDQFVTPDFYVPLAMLPSVSSEWNAALFEDRDARRFQVHARLQPGVGREDAAAELRSISGALAASFPETNRDWTAVLLTEVERRMEMSPSDAGMAATLMALAMLVLLIACANVAILLLGRARARTREIAIRLAVGVGRRRLFRQMMTESVVLALAGAIAGLGLAVLAIQFFSTFRLPTDLPVSIKVQLDQRVLLLSLAAAALSSVVFGLAPAWQTLRTNLIPQLKAGDTPAMGAARQVGRSSLVVAQVAFSVVLLVAAAMMIRGFQKILTRDPGFRNAGIAMATMDTSLLRYTPEQSTAYFDRAQREAQALPGVEQVAYTTTIPFASSQSTRRVVPEGYLLPKGRENVRVFHTSVGEGYFDVMGIAVVGGRAFTDRDREGSVPVAMVNEEFVKRYWPGSDGLGKRIRPVDSGKELEIVGVTKTGLYLWVGETPIPYLYLPLRQNPRDSRTLLSRTKGEAAAIPAIRERLHTLDADIPIFDMRTMDEFFEQRAVESPKFILKIVAAMGLLGLVLAVTGLYGVVSYSVARRTREIGIRIALGAGKQRMLRMVLRQGVLLAGIGIAIGLTGTLFVARLIEAGFAGASSADPLAVALVLPFLLLVTLAACVIPARRAAEVNPVIALRQE